MSCDAPSFRRRLFAGAAFFFLAGRFFGARRQRFILIAARRFDDTHLVAFQKRRAQTGSEFLPLHLQRVVVISCCLRTREHFRVWSLAEPAASEPQIIQRFFEGIEKYTPQIVSWNGGGFDLPVLHYRALIHGIQAPSYWDQGEHNRDAKFNNYLGRFHSRHTDLMDLLAGYQARAVQPLDQLGAGEGLPGVLGKRREGVQIFYRIVNDQVVSLCRAVCTQVAIGSDL